MKARSKAKAEKSQRKLSADAKFAQSRRTEVALTRRDPNSIPADRGTREKKSTTQGSE